MLGRIRPKMPKIINLAHLSGIVWISSLVAFFGIVFNAHPKSGVYSSLQSQILWVSLIVGIFSFALAVVLYFLHFVNSDSKLTKKKGKGNKGNYPVNFRWLTVGLSVIVMILLIALFTKNTNYFSGATEDQIPTPQASSTPAIESPTPTTAPVYVDPDPIVNCGPGQNSGQYVKDRQSNCKNYVDCGFSNNIWTMMLKSDCDKKHTETSQGNNQQQTGNNNKVPVFISFPGYVKNCPSQNVSAIQGINSAMESGKVQWDKDFMTCNQNFWNTDSCYVTCKAGDINNYGECIKQCPSAADACKWAYYQRDNLVSQIDSLCN